MREGSLEAPVRHPIPWRDEAFYDTDALEAELRRASSTPARCATCAS